MTRTEKKYEKKIMKLVKQYCAATTVMQKSLICMEANSLKGECARLLLNGKISDGFYKEIFCVRRVFANHGLFRIRRIREDVKVARLATRNTGILSTASLVVFNARNAWLLAVVVVCRGNKECGVLSLSNKGGRNRPPAIGLFFKGNKLATTGGISFCPRCRGLQINGTFGTNLTVQRKCALHSSEKQTNTQRPLDQEVHFVHFHFSFHRWFSFQHRMAKRQSFFEMP